MTPQEAKRVRERAERYKRQGEEDEARAAKTIPLDEETQTSTHARMYIPDELPDLNVMLTALCEHLNIRLTKENKRTLLQNYAPHALTTGLTPHEIVYVSCSNKLLLARVYGKLS
jgi:hypothetical protein